MPQIRLHYDGWLTLPAAMRDQLGMKTGDQLVAELANGGLILRRAGRGGDAAPLAVAPMPAAEPEPAPVAPPAVKRGRGRPRKTEATAPAPGLAAGLTDAPAKRKPGRPRKVVPTQEAETEPAPRAAPPTELRRKVLPPAATEAQVAVDRPAHDGPGPVSVREPEERRPFRHVEVRKLTPQPRVGGRRRIVAVAE